MLSVHLNDRIEALDFNEALAKVSEQRRTAVLRYRRERDRRLSLAAYLLLLEALQTCYGIVEPPEFSFGEHGKPVLRDYPGIHFNLSHCPRAALCVVADEAVGCDIEAVRESVNTDLCRYCFNAEETAAILHADNPSLAFTSLWTKKEAYLKLTGHGLTDDLPSVLASPGARAARFSTSVSPDGSYVYTVCRHGQA